jgi:hypothetical protein
VIKVRLLGFAGFEASEHFLRGLEDGLRLRIANIGAVRREHPFEEH